MGRAAGRKTNKGATPAKKGIAAGAAKKKCWLSVSPFSEATMIWMWMSCCLGWKTLWRADVMTFPAAVTMRDVDNVFFGGYVQQRYFEEDGPKADSSVLEVKGGVLQQLPCIICFSC